MKYPSVIYMVKNLRKRLMQEQKILFVSIRRQPGQLILGIELLINYVNVLHTIISSKTM